LYTQIHLLYCSMDEMVSYLYLSPPLMGYLTLLCVALLSVPALALLIQTVISSAD
jgi:hypothetical protein